LKHWKGLEAFPNVQLGKNQLNVYDLIFHSIVLEQYDYDKGQFEDDCFKINAIPLRSNYPVIKSPRQNELSQMRKFPEDLVYAYLCEVCFFFISFSFFLKIFIYLDTSISSSTLRRTMRFSWCTTVRKMCFVEFQSKECFVGMNFERD
jgi:hypothetical protein